MMIRREKHTVLYVGLPEAVMCDVSPSPFPCNADCAHTLWVILLITSHTYFMSYITHHILHILYGWSHSSQLIHILWVSSLITSYTYFMGYLTHQIPHIIYGLSHLSHPTRTLWVTSAITSAITSSRARARAQARTHARTHAHAHTQIIDPPV